MRKLRITARFSAKYLNIYPMKGKSIYPSCRTELGADNDQLTVGLTAWVVIYIN